MWLELAARDGVTTDVNRDSVTTGVNTVRGEPEGHAA